MQSPRGLSAFPYICTFDPAAPWHFTGKRSHPISSSADHELANNVSEPPCSCMKNQEAGCCATSTRAVSLPYVRYWGPGGETTPLYERDTSANLSASS